MRKSSKRFDPSRRDLFRQGVAAATGVVAAGTFLRAQPARAAKVAQAVAQYQDKPHDHPQCDLCVHFIPGASPTANGTCQLVAGSISPKGWCILFAAKKT